MRRNRAFRELRRRMLAQGLSADYVRRYEGELRDHFEAVVEEGVAAGMREEEALEAAERRLGRPEELARAAVARVRQDTFGGRHPWLFFGVWPVFALVFALVGVAIVCGVVAHCMSESMLLGAKGWAPALCPLINYAVPCALGLVYVRAARRRGMGRVWGVVPCVLLAVVATTLRFSIWYGEKSGAVSVGAGWPTWPGFLPMVTLLLWGAYVGRGRLRWLVVG